jgi:hypothetical protein
MFGATSVGYLTFVKCYAILGYLSRFLIASLFPSPLLCYLTFDFLCVDICSCGL